MIADEGERLSETAPEEHSGNDASGSQQSVLRRQRQRDLDAHDRMMKAQAAHSARDILHDSTPFEERGTYTLFEARDRAAHTPSITREMERQTNMADKSKSPFTDQERYLLDVQRRRDMAEIYPDSPEGQWLRERDRLAEANPHGPEARQIQEETRVTKLYGEAPEGARPDDKNNEREVRTQVTDDQKQRVDQALGKVELSNQIGGAGDAGSSPKPNDPTPLEQSKNIGQDLQRQGVTMDPDK